MLTLIGSDIPATLTHIPQPPTRLFCDGPLEDLLDKPRVAIVGTRKASGYGRSVTETIAADLARQGVVIVSGLALGVDGIAHQSALHAGGACIAVLPTPLDTIYPASHRQLANKIITQGGALISEYESGTPGLKKNFIERNRLVSGLSDVVLITEAALKSGTMHTANFALDQGKTVMAVPGNIDAAGSQGTNSLIKVGASLVMGAEDVLQALGIGASHQKQLPLAQNKQEQIIISLLTDGAKDAAWLQVHSTLPADIFNQTLTMLEINGAIIPLGGGKWSLRV